MSVAFRRDSDEEHLEPRFELPIPAGPNLVTPTGLSRIEARVAELENAVAGEVDAMLLAEMKRDLRYWRTRLATAQVMPPPPKDEVGFGSRVTAVIKGAVRTVDIVGYDEADPAADSIAFSAPLARALIGALEGDQLEFGGQKDAIEVINVRPIVD